MNKQDIFNAAYNGVIEQGGPALKGVNCAYRTPCGTKYCGMGHVMKLEMPEDHPLWYSSIDAGDLLIELDIEDKFLKDIRADVHLRELCEDIQMAHDNAALSGDDIDNFIENFVNEMLREARLHNLEVPQG